MITVSCLNVTVIPFFSSPLWQGQQFPAILTDSSLTSQSGSGSQQVILVSHTPHAASANSDEITYQVDTIHSCIFCGWRTLFNQSTGMIPLYPVAGRLMSFPN